MIMEQQLSYKPKNCNSKLLCKSCRLRLRRLEFEVNEMKLINAFLKEQLHRCEVQSKVADQKSSGASSSSQRPTTNKSPECFSNFSENSSNVQSWEFSNLSRKTPVNLQKKLIEWTEQYCLLASKYNEMVDRLQTCQDALYFSSKQNHELEKVNLELQIQLKEILQVKHSSNEDRFVQNLGAEQDSVAFSIESTPQSNVKEQSPDGLDAYMSMCTVHDIPFASAACVRAVASDNQRNMVPMSNTTQNSMYLPSSYSVSQPGFMHAQEDSITSIACVNMEAQVQDLAAPYNQPANSDAPQFAVSTSVLGWKPASSMVLKKNAIVMERRTPKKKQSPRQVNTPLSQVASPSDRSRWKKSTTENIPYITQADYSPISAFPKVCETSPTAGQQSHDEQASTVINIPKIISIRANPHHGHLHGLEWTVQDEEAPALSPLDPNKSQKYHQHDSTPIRKEVEKEVKVVALAENMECVAFPQGAYKTEMCNKWVKSMGQFCPYNDKCQFAHGPHELRPVLRHCRYKSILCRMVAAGEVCPYEHRCHFRHAIYPHEAELLSFN